MWSPPGLPLISIRYIRLATSNVGAKKIKYEAKKADAKSPLMALTGKELKKFFTSSVYILNSGIGLVFTVAIAVVALINADTVKELAYGLFGNSDYLAPALAMMLVFLSSMNMMSSSALSLEGKNLWILKTVPVSDNTVILSKVLPQIIVTTPPVLLSSLLMIVAAGASPIYYLFIILTPVAANVGFAFLGLCFNILAPKFQFDNEAQVIKQSGASFLTVLSGMLIGIGALLLAIFLGVRLGGLFSSLIITLAVLAAAVVFYCLLSGIGRKKMEKI